MPYDKSQCQAAGHAVAELGYAVADGLDMDDASKAMAVGTAFMQCADELKEDTDAALAHIAGAILDRVGDRQKDAPEGAEGS